MSSCHITMDLSFTYPTCLFNLTLILTAILHPANTDSLNNPIMLIFCSKINFPNASNSNYERHSCRIDKDAVQTQSFIRKETADFNGT